MNDLLLLCFGPVPCVGAAWSSVLLSAAVYSFLEESAAVFIRLIWRTCLSVRCPLKICTASSPLLWGKMCRGNQESLGVLEGWSIDVAAGISPSSIFRKGWGISTSQVCYCLRLASVYILRQVITSGAPQRLAGHVTSMKDTQTFFSSQRGFHRGSLSHELHHRRLLRPAKMEQQGRPNYRDEDWYQTTLCELYTSRAPLNHAGEDLTPTVFLITTLQGDKFQSNATWTLTTAPSTPILQPSQIVVHASQNNDNSAADGK